MKSYSHHGHTAQSGRLPVPHETAEIHTPAKTTIMSLSPEPIHMTHFIIRLFAILLVSMFTAANTPQAHADVNQPMRVLFIGNSYTSVNNLPGMVQALATAAKEPRRFEFAALTPGGWSLQRHVDEEKSEAPKKIAEGKWDFVVLQDQSQMPFVYPKVTLDYGSKLGALIKEQKATPLLYLTWAREHQPENQATITKTYTELSKALDCPIAPVGPAWEAARAQRKELVLYHADNSHPSPAGTYLAACVFYAKIYGKSPEGLPAKLMLQTTGKPRLLADVPQEDAAFLQKIAWKTVKP